MFARKGGVVTQRVCQAHRVVTKRAVTPVVTIAPGGWYPWKQSTTL